MHIPSLSGMAISLLSLYTTITTALPIPTEQRHDTRDAQQVASWGVVGQNFPDPSFIKLNDGLYAFATSGNGKNIQIAKSTAFDNPSWTILNLDALPNPGPWAVNTPGLNIWAPYVTKTTTGTFVLYYAAPPTADPSKHCIGTATSASITGPYTPSNAPFACNLAAGGAIDPTIFTDPVSSNTYVVYKVDGNSLGAGAPTPIMLQQINPADGLSQIGAPTQIFTQDTSAADVDGPLVEAPAVMYANGTYFLLFSTHMYDTAAYDIRYTTAPALTGPYSYTQTVLLQTGDGNGFVAPGSCDVHDNRIVFHGTVRPDPNLTRDMYAGYLQVEGSTLTFAGAV